MNRRTIIAAVLATGMLACPQSNKTPTDPGDTVGSTRDRPDTAGELDSVPQSDSGQDTDDASSTDASPDDTTLEDAFVEDMHQDADAIPDSMEDSAATDLDIAADPELSDSTHADSDTHSADSDGAETTDSEVVEDVEVDTGPPPTPAAGTFAYRKASIGGLDEAVAVAFHPDGSYAIVLDRTDLVHVWVYDTAVILDPSPSGRASLRWHDVVFNPEGTTAYLLGSEIDGDSTVGVIYEFDDVAWRAREGDDETGILTERTGLPAVQVYSSMVFPWDKTNPAVLSYNDQGGGNYSVFLREFDPEEGTLTLLHPGVGGQRGPCTDVVFAKDENGRQGVLMACNTELPFFYDDFGVPTWDRDAGGSRVTNVGGIAAYPGGEYALAASTASGARLYRFQRHEILDPSPDWSNRRSRGIEFQQNGSRAIIYGKYMDVTGPGEIGTVFEYRHDLFERDEITEQHIINFGSAPYIAENGFAFHDASWKAGCDGGLLVGGDGDRGLAILFEVEGAESCWPPAE